MTLQKSYTKYTQLLPLTSCQVTFVAYLFCYDEENSGIRFHSNKCVCSKNDSFLMLTHNMHIMQLTKLELLGHNLLLPQTPNNPNNMSLYLISCLHSSVPEKTLQWYCCGMFWAHHTESFFAIVVYALLCFSCCCCACLIHFFKCPSILHRRCFIYSFCVHTVVRLCA